MRKPPKFMSSPSKRRKCTVQRKFLKFVSVGFSKEKKCLTLFRNIDSSKCEGIDLLVSGIENSSRYLTLLSKVIILCSNDVIHVGSNPPS